MRSSRLSLLLLAFAASACREGASPSPPARAADTETVGRRGASRTVLPVNQVVTPSGVQVELPGLRPQALTLSPDGRILLTAGKTAEIVVVDPASGAIRQRVPLPKTKAEPQAPSANILEPDKEGQLSYTGLAFAPGGRSAYLSDVNGSVVVFDVAADGVLSVARSIRLPDARAPRRKEEIPAGLAVSADGTKLYVCGNLSNRLFEVAVADGRVRRVFDVGVAPYDVVLAGGKAYVSNWGGRRPLAGELTGPAGRGTEVKVDPVTHVANEGSVTVIDLATGTAKAEVMTGLHASALAVSPDGRHVVCANAASDTLSVIDTRSDAVVETIGAKPSPADLFGAQPNALAFDPSGRTLYVANGTQNAVAVVAFKPGERQSKLQGLIPVGWFPGALVFDGPRRTLHVANIKGHATVPKAYEEEGVAPGATGFNSHHYSGSLSLVPVPEARELPALSDTVWRNLRRERIAEALLPPRPGQPARAVPERIGEPSLIKHVVYVIKENRTYDQVLGDVEAGNGDPRLCIFGALVTPNQHKLVRDFALLDNTYCAGILSADGHQWSTTAIGTDYLERSFAGWPRSYPDGMGEDEADALAYSPAGFLWDNALRHGIRIRNYGEFMAPAVKWRDPKRKGSPDFLANYRTWKRESEEAVFASEPMIETIRPFSPTAYVGWEMAVPDQYRADFILAELAQFVARGEFPQLTIICLPNDHTSGTSEGSPTPAATVADNDLAFGRIVEALSHSPFWREMAILAIEDDPQNGFDHVSGYRTTAYVASPYARRGAVVSTQYNTTSLVRTLEQILGLPPMNQLDASAVPMGDAFTDTPDYSPFVAVPSNVPLDQMNPAARALADPLARRDALASARMNFREVDKAPEDALNRILWRAMKGTREPYPEWAVTAVADDDD
ncbi:MAG TPA: bifunctional YncE family protein/alkaline phosphatase family protein [Vicinamibacteria bacterium]|nr:bifunctional YncE family protein/alkaline phosphatase family protein [Vicinamibacteria bacterium]